MQAERNRKQDWYWG